MSHISIDATMILDGPDGHSYEVEVHGTETDNNSFDHEFGTQHYPDYVSSWEYGKVMDAEAEGPDVEIVGDAKAALIKFWDGNEDTRDEISETLDAALADDQEGQKSAAEDMAYESWKDRDMESRQEQADHERDMREER